jgi:hypothetical protein
MHESPFKRLPLPANPSFFRIVFQVGGEILNVESFVEIKN